MWDSEDIELLNRALDLAVDQGVLTDSEADHLENLARRED